MAERKVDVMDKAGKVLHTYPITIAAWSASDAEFEKEALNAARMAKLVPDAEFVHLKTRMHRAPRAGV